MTAPKRPAARMAARILPSRPGAMCWMHSEIFNTAPAEFRCETKSHSGFCGLNLCRYHAERFAIELGVTVPATGEASP